ncbi:MAG: DNA cytosine methyltransferase [Caulobacteraceae bacterium]
MDSPPASPLTYYEFFAGGGMARTGLGPTWACLFANDVDAGKARAYRANFGDEDLRLGDVWKIDADSLPGRADLAWASSPCQDLSLAGNRAGLSGARSSAFWGFWRLITALNDQGRAPRTVVIENVGGLFTSHGGADFTALCQALSDQGYRFGAVEIDAALFLPQSRPRLFVVATHADVAPGLVADRPALPFHTARTVAAHARLPAELQASWVWWALATPPRRNTDLASLLEPDHAVAWRTPEQTARMLADLAPAHLAKLQAAQASGERRIGALFRRVRVENGVGVKRAEVRFDGLAGCLRTPGGGSSRQFIVVVEGETVRTRQLTPREGARLMGLPDSYILPPGPTAAFKVIGDGVACPAVRHLAAGLLQPLSVARLTLAAE